MDDNFEGAATPEERLSQAASAGAGMLSLELAINQIEIALGRFQTAKDCIVRALDLVPKNGRRELLVEAAATLDVDLSDPNRRVVTKAEVTEGSAS
jgi:hypothetical protein